MLLFTFCFGMLSSASSYQEDRTANAALSALFELSLESTSTDAEMLWVHALLARYPELRLYASERVSKSEEGEARVRPNAFSVRVFGAYYPEFDRTLMVLKCFFLIQSGSQRAYEVFVEPQTNNKLTREHFDLLHARLEYVLLAEGRDADSVCAAFLVALVLGDIGKIDGVHEWMKRYGINDLDHDVFYGSIMKHPYAREALPSFRRLSFEAQDLLVATANLGHWGHITHLEGGVALFEPLKHSFILENDLTAFIFQTLVHTCDVAGAGGHSNVSGSIIYNEKTFQTLETVYAACMLLGHESPRFAYDYYLSVRAESVGLTVTGSEREVLGRVAAMLRLNDTYEGCVLEEASQEWTPEDRALILKNLSIEGASRFLETPTYIPALLVNGLNHPVFGETRVERLREVVRIGVPWIASVMDAYWTLLESGSMDPSIPLNFNAAAGQVKEDPFLMHKKQWHINVQNGSIAFLLTESP
jgi:hypothetical protein